MRVRVEATGAQHVLDDVPLGSGGEATVHAVVGHPELVAKVYRKPAPEQAAKLTAMIADPPAGLAGQNHVSIAWPTSRLLAAESEPRFVGYLMSRVHDTRLLYEIFNPRSRQQVAPRFHFGHLLRVARNLSAALRALHERGYIVGDVNESNILVTRDALVTLIDTDSFQVRSGAQVYRCRVGKPEYTPPELQRARFAEVDRTPEHDNFGLAVLIFQLLMQGTHPFTGVYTGPGEPGAVPRWIEAGFFPYSSDPALPVRPRPHAPPWKVLPPAVQVLMRQCFEAGHTQPNRRPTAALWLAALDQAEQELARCETNAQHLYPKVLTNPLAACEVPRNTPAGGLGYTRVLTGGCPWCEMNVLQGRDPFPTSGAAPPTAAPPTAVRVPTGTVVAGGVVNPGLEAVRPTRRRVRVPVSVPAVPSEQAGDAWSWSLAVSVLVVLVLLGIGVVLGMVWFSHRMRSETRPASSSPVLAAASGG